MELRDLLRNPGLPTRLACALAVAAWIFGTLACAVPLKIEEDQDRHPTTDIGVRATILRPGQQPPPMTPPPSAGPYPGAPPVAAPGYPTASAGGGFSSLGGTRQDINTSRRVESTPTWFRYVAWPFAAVSFPFRKIGEWIQGDPNAPDPAAEAAAAENAPVAPPSREALHAEEERARLRALEEQLTRQRRGGRTSLRYAPAPPVASSRRTGGGRSIAEELAALRQALAPQPSHGSSSAQSVATRPGRGPADRVRDRDGDGRPDFWVYRDGERVAREAYDENSDGRPDRILSYDTAGRLQLVEEDMNGDGAIDSWTRYQAGEVVRRRADSDGDGAADTWTFYRDGQIARHEQDTDGDGFRDRVELFEAGTRVREEQDRNGDGRPDVITWYDSDGRPTRRDEDSDGDGAVDVRSHYEGGRLARRELLSETGLGVLSGSSPDDREAQARRTGALHD